MLNKKKAAEKNKRCFTHAYNIYMYLFKKSKVANLLSGRFQEICSDQKIGNAKHLSRSILV